MNLANFIKEYSDKRNTNFELLSNKIVRRSTRKRAESAMKKITISLLEKYDKGYKAIDSLHYRTNAKLNQKHKGFRFDWKSEPLTTTSEYPQRWTLTSTNSREPNKTKVLLEWTTKFPNYNKKEGK